jgi:hypothetical protein
MLALFGGLSTIYLCYNVGVILSAGLHPQRWPADTLKRSYFTQTQCGGQTDPLCTGPSVPISRRTITVAPDGTPRIVIKLPASVPQTKCPSSPTNAPLTGSC